MWKLSSLSGYSAQGQVLHCKLRNQGHSCAQRQIFLSAPHSLFSIWTDLKGSEKIPGAPAWRWGECIRLNGLSGLHRNSTQRFNISSIRVFDQIRHPEIPITLRPQWDITYLIQGFTIISLPLQRAGTVFSPAAARYSAAGVAHTWTPQIKRCINLTPQKMLKCHPCL